MWRCFSIAIFLSVASLASANYNAPGHYSGFPAATFPYLDAPEAYGTWGPNQNPYWPVNVETKITFRYLSWSTQYLSVVNATNGAVIGNLLGFAGNSWASWVSTPSAGPKTINVTADFSAEYAGQQVEFRQRIGTNWSRMGSLYVVPNNGGTFTNSQTFAGTNISEVGLFVDGVYVSRLYDGGTNGSTQILPFSELGDVSAIIETGASQPAWRIVDGTGRVMVEGTASSSPAEILRTMPLANGQTATLQAYVQPVRYQETDGMLLSVPNGSGYWTNTGLSMSAGGNISGYYRAPLMSQYAPSTLSTNTASVFTNSYSAVMTNRPSGVTNYIGGSASYVTNIIYTNQESLVSSAMDVQSFVDQDDGEQNALARAQGLLPSFKKGLDDFKAGFSHIQSAFDAFVGIVPGNVGRNCTLQVGPYAVDLSGGGWIREAAKYVVFLWAAAAIAMQLGRLIA